MVLWLERCGGRPLSQTNGCGPATILGNLAVLHTKTAASTPAPTCERALAIHKACLGPGHPGIACTSTTSPSSCTVRATSKPPAP